MTVLDIFLALTVYIIIPITGMLLFRRLKNKMIDARINNAPITDLTIIFGTYGGLLLLTLTVLIWPSDWSGIASLGTFYLIIVAPIVMGRIAYRHRHGSQISKYHYITFMSGILYFAIAPVTLTALYFATDI